MYIKFAHNKNLIVETMNILISIIRSFRNVSKPDAWSESKIIKLEGHK